MHELDDEGEKLYSDLQKDLMQASKEPFKKYIKEIEEEDNIKIPKSEIEDPDSDLVYGFYHEEWPFTKEYQDTINNSEWLKNRNKYRSEVTNLGKKICGDYYDKKIKNSYFGTYGERMRSQIDKYMDERQYYNFLNKHKGGK